MTRAHRPQLLPWGLAEPVWWLLCLAVLCCTLPVAAQHSHGRRFDVAAMPDRSALAPRVGFVEDASGELTLADLRTEAGRRRFRPIVEDEVSFGFTRATLWLKLETQNRSRREARWLLELDQPTLDDVQLHVVHADGRVEMRQTGDMFPFSSRQVPHGSFTFELTEAPGAQTTYYLRCRTIGSMSIPLVAWRPSAYLSQHERENLGFWLFYGALGVLAIYNFCVFCMVGRREHLWYVVIALALCTVQMSLNGHVAQFLLPNQPAAVNRVLPVAIAVALLGIAVFAREVIYRMPVTPRIGGFIAGCLYAACLLVVVASFAPLDFASRAVRTVALVVAVAGPVLVRVVWVRSVPDLRLYHYCWYPLIVCVPVALSRYAHVLPPIPLSAWALQIGCTAHGLMISLALASWGHSMRSELATVNAQLTANVDNLQLALRRAEEANQQALRATKAKDDFVATMSHELRTPLNAIINIPQGLIREFDSVPNARCDSCKAAFLLEAGERVAPTTLCEACGAAGTLKEGIKTSYRGDLARCLRFLQKIERSGQHLLQMVNGVLDFSKLEAGRFQLSLAPADLEQLTKEVVDQMSDLAQRKDIQLLVTTLSALPPVTLDPLRIKQVLINLIANAIKFSEPNCVVGIALGRAGDTAVIEVQDSGIGIDEADHERIFTAFEQVHKGDTRKYGGTGLGLSISRSLVRMHGGELTVRSELGHGATFIARLPRMPNVGISQVGQTSELGLLPSTPERAGPRVKEADSRREPGGSARTSTG
jgi:signal transduction histidine kinase